MAVVIVVMIPLFLYTAYESCDLNKILPAEWKKRDCSGGGVCLPRGPGAPGSIFLSH